MQLTHHSDSGIQYCSGKYVKLLQDNEIRISMTENGDPLENAIAERVKGNTQRRISEPLPNEECDRSKETITNSN